MQTCVCVQLSRFSSVWLEERWMCPWGAPRSYTPLIQSISRLPDRIVAGSLAAVTLPLFALFISISIFSSYLPTPFYLHYFREIPALHYQRQSPVPSEGRFNTSRAVCKLHNTIKLGRDGALLNCSELPGQLLLTEPPLLTAHFHTDGTCNFRGLCFPLRVQGWRSGSVAKRRLESRRRVIKRCRSEAPADESG